MQYFMLYQLYSMKHSVYNYITNCYCKKEKQTRKKRETTTIPKQYTTQTLNLKINNDGIAIYIPKFYLACKI